MSSKSKKYYLPPEKFIAEYDACVAAGEPSAKLLHYFEKIALGYASKYNNTSKKDKDSIVSFALTEAWRKWHKYDENRSKNIFAFFTTMISNDMKTHYNFIFGRNKNKQGKYKFVSIEKLLNSNK